MYCVPYRRICQRPAVLKCETPARQHKRQHECTGESRQCLGVKSGRSVQRMHKLRAFSHGLAQVCACQLQLEERRLRRSCAEQRRPDRGGSLACEPGSILAAKASAIKCPRTPRQRLRAHERCEVTQNTTHRAGPMQVFRPSRRQFQEVGQHTEQHKYCAAHSIDHLEGSKSMYGGRRHISVHVSDPFLCRK